MQDILPEDILVELRDHYYAGVKRAEMGFKYSTADEDSITGALGQALLTPEPRMIIARDGTAFAWMVYHHVLGGGGKYADERFLGADGIFQLEAMDQKGVVMRRKGLLFQSKKRWRGRNKKLLRQATDLVKFSPSAIVVNYTDKGYDAMPAGTVIRAEGNRREVPREYVTDLAKMLGDEFAYCRRGELGLFWDPIEHTLLRDGQPLYQRPVAIKHVIGTRVARFVRT